MFRGIETPNRILIRRVKLIRRITGGDIVEPLRHGGDYTDAGQEVQNSVGLKAR